MKFKWLVLMILTALQLVSCGKKSEEYTDEMPPTESATVQTIDTVDHSSTNAKDPVFEQKN